MPQEKILSGETKQELLQQLTTDLKAAEDFIDYRAILELKKKKDLLDIFIDPGGGFEASTSGTKFQSTVINNSDFQFALQ